jgi:hypothetical protein
MFTIALCLVLLGMAEIKYQGNRVSYREEADQQTIVILPDKNNTRYLLLSSWIVLFGLCGLMVFSQLFFPYSSDVKIFLAAFLVFWSYFMFMAVRSWLYLKKGGELIRFAEGRMSIKRAIGEYGKAVDFFVDNMTFIELRETDKKSFASELENSFWVLGGQALYFGYNGNKQIRFGIRLNEKEAKELRELMNKWIKKIKYSSGVNTGN